MKNNIRHAAASIIMVTLAHSGAMAQTVNRAPASGGLVAATQLGSGAASAQTHTKTATHRKTSASGETDAAAPSAPSAPSVAGSQAAPNSATAAPVFGGVGTPMPTAGAAGASSTTQAAAMKGEKQDAKN